LSSDRGSGGLATCLVTAPALVLMKFNTKIAPPAHQEHDDHYYQNEPNLGPRFSYMRYLLLVVDTVSFQSNQLTGLDYISKKQVVCSRATQIMRNSMPYPSS